ncbi:hypothetical protein IAI10_00970 [Clostridium sp. 19966]|uniref:hypothetical protein n=1 Tax=Clostridium sp. 19966 TaxID=2768166 RepID=UPI0028DEF564|nr:hypothetical protein [Clostridium sp. 19966]MDT8715249.1 hypothetical protein [Clostridium sp. 19966]
MTKDGDLWNTIKDDSAPFAEGKPMRTSMDILYKFVNSGCVEKDITTSNWEASKTDLGYMAFPTDNSGSLYSVSSADRFFAVNKNSKHTKEAKDFLYSFLDSDYADTQGFIPAKKGMTSNNTVIKDFLSSGVQLITTKDGKNGDEADKRQKIADNSGVDINGGGAYEQNVALAAKKGQSDYANLMNDMNKKWADAKTKLEY